MDLKEFARHYYPEEERFESRIKYEAGEFERRVRVLANKLKFEDITREITKSHFRPLNFGYLDFQAGQQLEFRICQPMFKVIITPDELVLKGGHDVCIARYSGEDAKRFYESLTLEILDANSKYEPPF